MGKPAWEQLPRGRFGLGPTQAGVDPMWIWGDSTNYRDFGPSGLDPAGGIRFVVEWKRELHPGAAFETIELTPQAWAERRDGILRIELAEPVVPERPALRRRVSAQPSGSPVRSEANVLVGVIDSGCPFAAKMLRDANGTGTRVLSIWDQDDNPAFTTAEGAFQPERHGYGCAIRRDVLNRAMAKASLRGSLDEELCYRSVDYDALSARFSHGAAVISQLFGPPLYGGTLQPQPGVSPSWDTRSAAGDGYKAPMLEIDRADLVFVQLPRSGAQDSTSAGLSRYILDGLRYILDHAQDGQRVVVNISSGTSRTTHDGQSLLESALVDLADSELDAVTGIKRDLVIVIPTGNTNEEQRHAVLSDEDYHLEFFLPPGCETPQYVTVRWPRGSEEIRLQVTSPAGDVGVIEQEQAVGWPEASRPECGVISVKRRPDGIAQTLIAFAPTASSDPNRVVARAGRWSFRLRFGNRATRLAEPVMFWVSRNQRNPGALPRTRQADFVDWDEQHNPRRYLLRDEEDPPGEPQRNGIRRRGALSGLATVKGRTGHLVVVGGYVVLTRDRPSSRYSAAGPAAGMADRGRAGPDVSAPADTSWALPGLSVRGSHSGDVVRVMGTSFAAPLLARAIVNGGLRYLPRARSDNVRQGALLTV